MARRAARSAEHVETALLPQRLEPMLAGSAPEPFDSDHHLFEIKWDGTRCLAFVEQSRLRLQNRRHVELSLRYPELEGLRELPPGTLLDSEIIVLEGGKPSFSRLQQREHVLDPSGAEPPRRRLPATMMVFDLLYVGGRSIMAEPLHRRRERLEELIGRLKDPHVLVPDYIVGPGSRYFAAVEQAGLEGIMAKRLDSPYLPGKRSPHWLKIKVARTEPFDIIGFVPQEGLKSVGALIIGMHDGRRWIYRGKVGTGFTEAQRREFFDLLMSAPPLERPPSDGPADAVWRLLGRKCMVRFFEKTVTGHLRAPVFKGWVT